MTFGKPAKNQNENGGAHGETTVRDEDRPRQAAWKMKREKVLCLINTILPTVAGVLFLISSFVNSSPILP